MRISRAALALYSVFALACFSDSGNDDDTDDDTDRDAPPCPFTFPEPTRPFAPEASPGLLNFDVFPDAEIAEDGAEGTSTDFLYTVNVPHPFIESDGSVDSNATISFIQSLSGVAVVLKPDEVAAERERLKNNAVAFSGATVTETTMTLGGQEVEVQVEDSPAAKIMTVFVPVDSGAFIAPTSLGVYTGRAGCDATKNAAFDALKASVTLNPNTTFNEIQYVIDAKAGKSE